MIDKNRACAFSGHRLLSGGFSLDELKKAVYKAINDGFDTFLCGMALGFDTVAFSVLEEVKLEGHPIKIIACIPCDSQSLYFKKKQKEEYDRMVSAADERILVSDKYFDGCMQKRNEFMVENCTRLITYLNFNRGGTYNTVKYAVSRDVEICYLGK